MSTRTFTSNNSLPLSDVTLPLEIDVVTRGGAGSAFDPGIDRITPVGGASVWSAGLTGFSGTYGAGGTGGYESNDPTPGSRGAIVFRWTGDSGGTLIQGPNFGDSDVTTTFNTTGKSSIVAWLMGNGSGGGDGVGGASAALIKAIVPSNIGTIDVELTFNDAAEDSSNIFNIHNGDGETSSRTPISGGTHDDLSNGNAYDDDNSWVNVAGSIAGNDGVVYVAPVAPTYGQGGGSGSHFVGTIASAPGGATSLVIVIDGVYVRVYFNTQSADDGLLDGHGSGSVGGSDTTDGNGWITAFTPGVDADSPSDSAGSDGASAESGGSGGAAGTDSVAATNGGDPGGGGGGGGPVGSPGNGGNARIMFSWTDQVDSASESDSDSETGGSSTMCMIMLMGGGF